MSKKLAGVINSYKKYCPDCDVVMVESYWDKHCDDDSHKEKVEALRTMSRNSFVLLNPVMLPSFMLKEPCCLEDQIQYLLKEILIPPKDCMETANDVKTDLKHIVCKAFGDCATKYTVYGSMATQLAIVNHSDLDIRVEIDIQTPGDLTPDDRKLRMVLMCFKKMVEEGNFCNVIAIRAHVPVVRAVHVETRTLCDISLSQLQKDKDRQKLNVVANVLNLRPRFFETFVIIKFWAKTEGIAGGPTYVSSFGWLLLFICYLQSVEYPRGIPIVPSLRQYFSCPRKSDLELPYDRFGHIDLLQGFFEFYSEASVFEENIFSPYLGFSVRRHMDIVETYDEATASHIRRLRHDAVSSKPDRLKIIQHPLTYHVPACPRTSLVHIASRMATAAKFCQKQPRAVLYKSTFLQDLFNLYQK